MKTYNAYINGKEIITSDWLEITSPIDNKMYGRVPALSKEIVDFAFESAYSAFKTWKLVDYSIRKSLILKFNDLLLKNKEELAEIIHHEVGKSIPEAIVEIERTIDYSIETISEWEQVAFSQIKHGNKTANLHRVPLGVVLAISPFNYPVNLSLAKIIPALVSGNTIVFKPATNGSLVGGFLAELFAQASFPAGVFNLVTGRGRDIGDFLTTNHRIAMISFTGGFEVGKRIAELSKLKPLILELGGNDMAYVKNDADIQLTAKEIVKGAFGFSGQRCTAIKRVAVDASIKDELIKEILKETEKIQVVPLISISAAKYVKELIDDSIKRNDEFVLKGDIQNNLITPFIVITTPESRAWKEEAFGPLLPIVIVSNPEEVIELFNGTNFGLQNSIFTRDIKWAKNISLQIESGTVNINRSSSRGPDIFPFSGIKDSGFGLQGIKYALESMTRILNVVEND